MAAIPLGGTTVHHWAGLADNRYTKEKTLGALDDTTRARINKADVLVLDEIGMISATVFSKLEYVIRHVRTSELIFGGIQLIACGDFKQLPPVPDSMHLDPGDYCFQTAEFNKSLPHRVVLTKVRRQDEPGLVKAIKELCDGEPSEDTNALLRSLDRPIQNQEAEPTLLFGMNFDVNVMNQEKVELMPGQPKIYKAVDSGDKELLSKSQAMKTLTLKVGAPVVLLKNLTNQLCNGTKGVVHSIDAEDPIIKFHGKLFKINKSAFEVFDTRQNKVRATRIQYPLKLGFCLTVHKAQGRTEPYLEVDCYNFFAPGQLGVAIGRAVSLENLRVRNYSPDCANIKHLPHVYDFYESCNQKDNLFQDMSCCHSAFQDEQQMLETNLSGNSEPPNAVNPWAGADVLNQATSQLSCSDDVMFDLSDCPPPAGIHVDNERLLEFAGSIESKLCTILPRDGQSKDAWASAFRLFHTYLLSNEYKQLLVKLFQTGTVSPAGNRYATKLAFGVHHALVASRAEAIKGKMDTAGKYNVEQPLSDIAKAKIRYIAGACLSRVTTRLRSRALSDITNKMHSATRKHAYAQQRLLTGLRVSEQHIIASTSEPASLSEIDNKQSATRGLFHVPDKVFSFFTKLHSTAQRYLSPSQFDEHQEKTFTACRDRVFGDPQLLVLWSDLFPVEDSCTDQDNELAQALVHELYNQVSEHYLRVCFVDALHEVKEKLPKTKKQALRSKIEGATKIKVAIKPETKRKKEMQEILCPICNQVCVEMPQSRSENSIQCDGCNEWFHILCAKVGSTKKIKKWFCSNCTKSR